MREPVVRHAAVVAAALTAALGAAPAALLAQTATASLRGVVTGAAGAPVADAQVQVRNVATGVRRGALTNGSGFYNVGGLQPGAYEVRVARIGFTPVVRTVRLLVGEVTTRDVRLGEAAVQLGAVQVTGTRTRDRTTSEVASNVTTEQIENLPQGNRNFLQYATLAPGVQQRGASVSSGGASVDNSNLFIDGATYKSDVLPGGVAGQDPSLARQVPGIGRVLGNPFPQSAVQEFRVITQNYKAEYQKASGAVVTAATKSGTNEVHGDLFYFGQNENFIARNAYQQANALAVPNYARSQFGGSLGGPIVRDRAHYFATYEGNLQNTDTRVAFQRPASVAVPDSLLAGQGLYRQPLRAHLFFGKVDYALSDRQQLVLTANVRRERDQRDFGGQRAASLRNLIDNDVNTVALRHTLSAQPYTNEAQVSFQRFTWAQTPEAAGLAQFVYEFPGSGVGDITRGGNSSYQDFVQDRLSLRDDLTRTLASHVLKGGGNIDFLTYNVNKRLDEAPTFRFATNRPGGLVTPYQASFQIGDPRLRTNNTQVGLYLQDDWQATRRLTLNLGVRWDYETHWFNYDFVTPRRYADSVRALEAQYPYFDPNQYVSTGGNRKRFYRAFQPRLGFSYDVGGDGRTVVFGGGGLFYDRVNYNVVLDEIYKVQRPTITFRFSAPGAAPGQGEIPFDPSYYSRGNLAALAASGQTGLPEVFLIRNDQKLPYTVQTSLGVRRTFGPFAASATGTLVNGYNYFKWVWGHRDPASGDLLFGRRGMSAVLISTDAGRSWYRAGLFQLSKPFTADARWGGDLSYTLAKTDVNTYYDVEDPFALDYWPGNARLPQLDFNRIPSRFDERHRVVLNLGARVPFGVRASTITTLGSGTPYTETTGCTSPTPEAGSYCASQPVPPTFVPDFLATPGNEGPRAARPAAQWFGPFGKWAYRNVDLRLQKDVGPPSRRVGISADVLNAFNFRNFNYADAPWFSYNVQSGGLRYPNYEFNTYDSRRVQLGARYTF